MMKRRGSTRDTMQLPTEAELEILNILWALGPSTVRDVHTASNKDTGYTTILKQMQVMAEKGLLTRSEQYIACVRGAHCEGADAAAVDEEPDAARLRWLGEEPGAGRAVVAEGIGEGPGGDSQDAGRV